MPQCECTLWHVLFYGTSLRQIGYLQLVIGKETEEQLAETKLGTHVWQSQVENEHFPTISGLIQLSLECIIIMLY